MSVKMLGRRSASFLLGLSAAALAADHARAQQLTFEKVVVSGQQVPGAQAGVTYSSFSRLSAATGGQFFVQALVAGGSVTASNDLALVGGSVNGPLLLAREGDQASGFAPGVTYSSIYGPATFMNATGDYSFGASLAGAGIDTSNDNVLYLGTSGGLSMALRKGDAAPGAAAGVTFASFGGAPVGNGQLAVNATLAGTGVSTSNNAAAYIGSPGTLNLVGRTGSTLSGLPAATVLDTISSVGKSTGGVSHYFTTLRGTGVTAATDGALYAISGATATLLLREGDAAPSFAGSTVASVYEIESPRGGNGHLLLRALLTGGGITPSNDGVLYAGPVGSPVPVVRDGDTASGVGANVKLELASPVAPTGQINGNGEIVFRTGLTGTGINTANDTAIYSGPYGAYSLIAREGSAVPGLSPAAKFGDLLIAGLRFGDGGQVAFNSTITGTGIVGDQGLFLYDPELGMQMVARAGQVYDLGGGDIRTASSINPPTFSLSNDGRLLFMVSFTDGSSAILSTQVPEPTTVAIGLPAVLGLLVRRRRALP